MQLVHTHVQLATMYVAAPSEASHIMCMEAGHAAGAYRKTFRTCTARGVFDYQDVASFLYGVN